MIIERLEAKFKKYTDLPPDLDLSIFPITEHTPFKTNIGKKKNNGEVFTPLQIVDKMILMSKPDPNKFNMDLCAGRGQFTIRMLRYFHNNFKEDFDIKKYLKEKHWFNEYDEDNAQDIINIFGNLINLCIGDARLLKKMPAYNNRWLKGIFFWNEVSKAWEKLF